MPSKKQQASRFLKPAPEKLARLIEIINLVPPDFELRRPAYLRIEAKVENEGPISIVLKLGKYVDEYIKTLPAELKDYLLKPLTPTWHGLLEGGRMGRYESFYAARQNLRVIAQLAKKGVDIAQLQPDMHGSLIPSISMVGIDSEGKVRISKDLLTEAVEGVEAARIRECEVCNRIFWAGRLDQLCCSKPCARVLRTRRWRAKYQDNYKLKRNGLQPLGNTGRKTSSKKKGR